MKKKVILGIVIGVASILILGSIVLTVLYNNHLWIFEEQVTPINPNNAPVALKPVVYLYPEEVTEVSVQLKYKGTLSTTYPAYNDGWKLAASPDGTLTDAEGKQYNYLFWEGPSEVQYQINEGFCVKGEDTVAFLEESLEKLGLTRKEANEFIVFWLPLMQDNDYNLICFAKDQYTDNAVLSVSPEPDSMIRVFMVWKASEVEVQLPEQQLITPDRTGFTVVEWGGAEIK